MNERSLTVSVRDEDNFVRDRVLVAINEGSLEFSLADLALDSVAFNTLNKNQVIAAVNGLLSERGQTTIPDASYDWKVYNDRNTISIFPKTQLGGA